MSLNEYNYSKGGGIQWRVNSGTFGFQICMKSIPVVRHKGSYEWQIYDRCRRIYALLNLAPGNQMSQNSRTIEFRPWRWRGKRGTRARVRAARPCSAEEAYLEVALLAFLPWKCGSSFEGHRVSITQVFEFQHQVRHRSQNVSPRSPTDQ